MTTVPAHATDAALLDLRGADDERYELVAGKLVERSPRRKREASTPLLIGSLLLRHLGIASSPRITGPEARFGGQELDAIPTIPGFILPVRLLFRPEEGDA